jgi:hypothetical protein
MLDSEQMFVLSGGHGEHRFDEHKFDKHELDGRLPPRRCLLPLGGTMAVTWTECAPEARPLTEAGRGPGLRLVEEQRAFPVGPSDPDEWGREPTPVVVTGAARRRVPLEVRRRRTLFAVMAGLLLVLILPLSGAGGHSHPIGSAPAESVAPGVYTVQPGDTLWSIAQRLDPSADPRPLVVQLAAQTGSESVVPGEKIDLP